jgi:asparagine synthase (glutamine-hydrolysing)
MCGIVGIYNVNNQPVLEKTLEKMADSIIHRGPDGYGYWVGGRNNKVGFGHRRLAIIDLSDAGKQPMVYREGKYVITYNGEIYNYIEIRERLKKKGFNFKTNSDTEVLLALYEDKKEKCLDELDGMFAFAIWDNENQELFCARDRFGEKPFHYFWDGNTFVFGSEIKAIFAGGIHKKINSDRLQEFIDNGEVDKGEETFFKNIKKLKASHFLKLSGDKLKIEKYWDVAIEDKIYYKKEEEYAEHFRELFITSIKRRLRSDVPVGSSLSGGLDSSSVVCFVREILGKDALQKTFSARFKNFKNDEGNWIDYVVEKARTKHYEVFPDPTQLREEMQRVLFHHENPFVSTSICAQWDVMRLAKTNGITVMLDGQGADEYLAGYAPYGNHVVWDHYAKFQLQEYFRELKEYKERYHVRQKLGIKYLAVPYLRALNIGESITGYYLPLKEKLKFDLFNNLGQLLAYADRNAMAFSIETRLPFLYHELVAFVLACPQNQLYAHATSKRMLRNAIQGIVPDEIVNRKDKIGYEAPQDTWMEKIYDEKMVRETLYSQGVSLGKVQWRNYIVAEFVLCFG